MNSQQLGRENEKRQLIAERTDLSLRKKGVEAKLSDIKSMIRIEGRMDRQRYQDVCESQSKCTHSMRAIEVRAAMVKKRLREIADEEFYERQNTREETAAKEGDLDQARAAMIELIAIRHDYQLFAADPTRISSMRQMAAEFVLKLNLVIQRAVREDKFIEDKGENETSHA